jgi:hypothetical protein
MEVQTLYFESAGPENTEDTLRLAKQRAIDLKIRTIVVPSTTGESGVKAMEILGGLNVIVVTHCAGAMEPNFQELTEQNRLKIIELGGTIYTAQHTFGGFNRAVRRRFKTWELDEIVASVLRLFGAGMKVAIEISTMASDAGLVRTDEDVVSLGGTARGLDTAIIIRPSNAHDFFNVKIREVVCKPREFKV